MERLGETFYHRPCVEVAEALVGKILVHGNLQLRITETEAYCGENDTACHARFGRTKRTEPLYAKAGTSYVYLCYGIHWLFNVVTGDINQPEAVLIRACAGARGPGKLTNSLEITGKENCRDLIHDPELWIGDDGFRCSTLREKRVGIDYASEEDRNRPWRFVMDEKRNKQ